MTEKETRAPLNIRRKATLAHVSIASFLFPMVMLVAVSGGLFLAGNQGSFRIEAVAPPQDAAIDVASEELEEDVTALLADADIEHSFRSLRIEQTPFVPEADANGEQEQEDAGHDHDHDHDHGDDDAPEPEETEEPMITTLTTQPAYKTHFRITVNPDGDVAIERRSPDLQRRLIGLHRGEAEAPFKYLQYVMAVGLLCVLGLGLYMGLSHRNWRWPTAGAAAVGLLLFLILVAAS